MPDAAQRQPWERQQRHILHEFRGRLSKRLSRKRGLSGEEALAITLKEFSRAMAGGIAWLVAEEMCGNV